MHNFYTIFVRFDSSSLEYAYAVPNTLNVEVGNSVRVITPTGPKDAYVTKVGDFDARPTKMIDAVVKRASVASQNDFKQWLLDRKKVEEKVNAILQKQKYAIAAAADPSLAADLRSMGLL